jgi:beta-lactam-binding protein with PASTA domain
VPIPALIGLSSADARQALDRVGLAYRLIFRPSDSAPAGTVIDSDPPEGREVPPDTEVTLVIASTATPSGSASSSAPANDAGLPDEE